MNLEERAKMCQRTAINVNTGKDYAIRDGIWLVVMNFPIYHAWKVIFVALVVCFCTVEATTSNAAYLTVVKGQRLVGSLIYEKEVESVVECALLCMSEQCRCKSINCERDGGKHSQGKIKCQLNHQRKVDKPEKLVADVAFNYLEPFEIKENKFSTPEWCSRENRGEKPLDTNVRDGTDKAPKSCADWYKNGKRLNGVYTINPDELGTFDVWCDMTTGGGGWIVFQRRMDGSVDFYRNWTDYKNGFGNLSGEFWLGLDKINRLSKSGQNVLRVDLGDFDNETRYAVYNTFAVSNETEKYELTVGNYSGNAGDSLGWHNGMKFTTRDVDNDKHDTNCAVTYQGAWWYNSCHASNLNGLYRSSPYNSTDSVNWNSWKESSYSFKNAEMKIRPRHF